MRYNSIWSPDRGQRSDINDKLTCQYFRSLFVQWHFEFKYLWYIGNLMQKSVPCRKSMSKPVEINRFACKNQSTRLWKSFESLVKYQPIRLQNINCTQNMRKVLHKCNMKCFTKSRCFIFRSSHHICGVKISMNNQMDHKNVFMKNFIYWVEQKRLFFELIMLFLKR